MRWFDRRVRAVRVSNSGISVCVCYDDSGRVWSRGGEPRATGTRLGSGRGRTDCSAIGMIHGAAGTYMYVHVYVRYQVLIRFGNVYRHDIQWHAKWNTIRSTVRASAWEYAD